MFDQYKKLIIISKLIFAIVCYLAIPNFALSEEITVKCLGGGDYTNISDAINNAYPDDIIEVYPCTYEEAVIIDKDLTLKGMGPQGVIISSPSSGITVQSNHIAKISGFTITSANNGIALENYSGATIKNNAIISNGGYGVYLLCDLIHAIIANNTIYSNTISGIYTGKKSIPYHCNSKPTIFNNIIVDNGGYGLYLQDTSESISHNDVWANSSGDYWECIAGFGDISENPRFMDSSNGNFVLRDDSPCKNSGTPGSADSDPDGSRNDMGAYGGSDCASFWPYPPGAPIITNLNAMPTSVPKGSSINIEATGEVYE